MNHHTSQRRDLRGFLKRNTVLIPHRCSGRAREDGGPDPPGWRSLSYVMASLRSCRMLDFRLCPYLTGSQVAIINRNSGDSTMSGQILRIELPHVERPSQWRPFRNQTILCRSALPGTPSRRVLSFWQVSHVKCCRFRVGCLINHYSLLKPYHLYTHRD